MSARRWSALASLALLVVALPARAQHAGHAPADPAAVDPHAAHAKPKAPAPATDPHAGHVMPAAVPDPHAGHVMPKPAVDPHAGHVMPTPAADPHAGHVMPKPAVDPHAGHMMPMPASDPHAGHVMPANAPDPHAGHVMPKPAVDPHAGHVMPMPAVDPHAGHVMPMPAPDPHAGHVMPKPAVDPHAGHAMPAPASDPHAGHGVPAPDAPDPHAGHVMPAPANAPRTPIPALTDADRAAAFPPVAGHAAHDRGPHAYWLVDHLEAARVDGDAGFGWEADAWIGGDVQRLWLRSEGEGVDGDVASADLEVLYGRGISAWWDVVAGVRHAWGDAPSSTTLALGVQGLAPYKIPVEATLYLGDGRASARVEAGYETLLTNRWIVQWEATADLHAGSDARRGEGAGLATLAAGARLRYEINRRFAPYVGIEAERAFGATADLRRAAGESIDDTRVVAGVRFWF